jgi:hypothetical protein
MAPVPRCWSRTRTKRWIYAPAKRALPKWSAITTSTRLTLTPAHLTFANGLEISIETEYHFTGGAIRATHRLLAVSDPYATLTAREYLKGCYRVTEYPQDMRGITLTVDGDQPQTLEYAYRHRELHSAHAQTVSAAIPQITTSVTLEAITPAESGDVPEGLLFSYYTLALDYNLSLEKEVST